LLVTNAALAESLRRNPRCTALFLGAGASAVFGYPITSQLLEKIFLFAGDVDFLADLDGRSPVVGRRNCRILSSYLGQLLPGKGQKKDRLPLVTPQLSLLDYSLATGQSVMAGRTVEETRDARRLLERANLEVIDDEEEFNEQQVRELDRFCGFMSHLRGISSRKLLTVITTNYDMAADVAAYECANISKDRHQWWDEDEIARRVDFGFDWYHPERTTETMMRRPRRPLVMLLKLHGSTNWLRCPLCDHIHVNPWGPIWAQACKEEAADLNTCHCTRTRLQAQIGTRPADCSSSWIPGRPARAARGGTDDDEARLDRRRAGRRAQAPRAAGAIGRCSRRRAIDWRDDALPRHERSLVRRARAPGAGPPACHLRRGQPPGRLRSHEPQNQESGRDRRRARQSG
jgi:hypothetical protein